MVELLKYVTDGQDHLNDVISRKTSNRDSKKMHQWITKETSDKK